MTTFEISLSNNQEIFPMNSDEIERDAGLILEHVLQHLEILNQSVLKDYDMSDKTISVDILLVDNEEIEALNSSYRGQDKPTDVLSFALFADNPDKTIAGNEIALGEVVISVETAKLQADDNKIELEDEVNFLLCHGILHLMGFTHPDEESLELLLEMQNEILTAIK